MIEVEVRIGGKLNQLSKTKMKAYQTHAIVCSKRNPYLSIQEKVMLNPLCQAVHCNRSQGHNIILNKFDLVGLLFNLFYFYINILYTLKSL